MMASRTLGHSSKTCYQSVACRGEWELAPQKWQAVKEKTRLNWTQRSCVPQGEQAMKRPRRNLFDRCDWMSLIVCKADLFLATGNVLSRFVFFPFPVAQYFPCEPRWSQPPSRRWKPTRIALCRHAACCEDKKSAKRIDRSAPSMGLQRISFRLPYCMAFKPVYPYSSGMWRAEESGDGGRQKTVTLSS